VRRAFEHIFDEFGLPDEISTDNGSPFASRGLAGLSRLSVWWLKLGIRHERIEPGKPQQNGRHERMHLTLKQHTASPPATSLRTQQSAFDRFRHEFNDERPHEALGQKLPSEFYVPSVRKLPDPCWRDFPYTEAVDTFRLSRLGALRWNESTAFISLALQHELVGIAWDGTWKLRFANLQLGILNVRKRRLEFEPEVKVFPMSLD
jgi:integrase-like protein